MFIREARGSSRERAEIQFARDFPVGDRALLKYIPPAFLKEREMQKGRRERECAPSAARSLYR